MNLRPEALIAYVPTPHAGYLKLFRAHAGAILYVLGNEFTSEFPSLVRNLPAVDPEEARQMILHLGIFADVRLLTKANVGEMLHLRIVMPDEDVSHAIAEKYFSAVPVSFDSSWRLRWDWGSVQKGRQPEGERLITRDEHAQAIMRQAYEAAKRSPDWWRQIGAVLSQDGEPLLVAFNRHVPSEQSAYCFGDPRSQFGPGQSIEVSGAMHAEMTLAAEVMRRGICTRGCDLSVTTFPCPPCAYPWAHAGIKRLFYSEGYSLVAAADTFRAEDVEIVRVEL